MRQVKHIKDDSVPITCVKFSQTGNYIAVGNIEGKLHLRNIFDF
jgi:hypothetical protein